MGPKWLALAREAGIAAEQLASGVTILGKANHAYHGLYNQAFFQLAIGFERSAKLIYILDFCIDNNGEYPSGRDLVNKGHDIKVLLQLTDEIGKKRGLSDDQLLPKTAIHENIINVLSEFAETTRYHNLNFLTGDRKAEQYSDPISVWHDLVTNRILEEHYTERSRKRHEANAHEVAALLSGTALIRHHRENGAALNSAYDASLHNAQVAFAIPFSRMYIMQIVRFLAKLISEVSHEAKACGIEDIPEMSEFFCIFNNDDDYFRRRKTWSIYGYR